MYVNSALTSSFVVGIVPLIKTFGISSSCGSMSGKYPEDLLINSSNDASKCRALILSVPRV